MKEKNLNQDAVDDFKQIVVEYPKSKEAAMALYEVARDYENKGLYKEAIQLQSKLLSEYNYTSVAGKAEELIGNNYIRLARSFRSSQSLPENC